MNFDCETELLIEIGSVSSFQIGEEILVDAILRLQVIVADG